MRIIALSPVIYRLLIQVLPLMYTRQNDYNLEPHLDNQKNILLEVFVILRDTNL